MTSHPEPAPAAPTPRDAAIYLLTLLREVGVVLYWIARAMLRGRAPLALGLLTLAAALLAARRHRS